MGLVATGTRGMIGGIVATAAMDLLWYRRYRDGGGDDDLRTWEFSSSATGFDDDAPAPARVGKLIADTIGVELDDSLVAPVNNIVHWLTGTGWATLAAFAARALPVPPLAVGLSAGVTAWGTSYAALGAVGIYEPITAYDADTLWKDLSAHLVFGATIGAVLELARARPQSRWRSRWRSRSQSRCQSRCRSSSS